MTAGSDFRRLLDAGLLVREGRTRNTRYLASESLRAEIEAAISGRRPDR